jgi:hypothetical protein
MPNWCSNRIEIQGNVDSIKAITEKLCNGADNNEKLFVSLVGEFTENYLYDSPIPFISDDSKVGDKYYDWYEHNRVEYGTKWDTDIELENIDTYDDYIHITNLETAWSPPIAFCSKLSKMYEGVEVTLHFEEGGMNFGGIYVFSGGEIISMFGSTYLGSKYKEDGLDGIYGDIEWLVECNYTDEEIHNELRKEYFYDEIKDELNTLVKSMRTQQV